MDDDHHDETWLESFRYAVGGLVAFVIIIGVALFYLVLVALSWIGEQLAGGSRSRPDER